MSSFASNYTAFKTNKYKTRVRKPIHNEKNDKMLYNNDFFKKILLDHQFY